MTLQRIPGGAWSGSGGRWLDATGFFYPGTVPRRMGSRVGLLAVADAMPAVLDSAGGGGVHEAKRAVGRRHENGGLSIKLGADELGDGFG